MQGVVEWTHVGVPALPTNPGKRCVPILPLQMQMDAVGQGYTRGWKVNHNMVEKRWFMCGGILGRILLLVGTKPGKARIDTTTKNSN